MTPLSVFITTLNNANTLPTCLSSVSFADEIVLLDSFSSDDTLAIARAHNCVIAQQSFQGYGPQKRRAMEMTTHNWVLLLDADEALSPAAKETIQALMERGPQADGYTLPRLEQQFWRMCTPATRMNYFLRLFNKNKGTITDMPVHAAPVVQGQIERLHAAFYHFGEPDIHVKVEKINGYSTGLIEYQPERRTRGAKWKMLLSPIVAFLRTYLLKRNFLNGWSGLIASIVAAFYAFLKYAKLYEQSQFARYGDSLMPRSAPPHPRVPR